jgi:hypothetical protein
LSAAVMAERHHLLRSMAVTALDGANSLFATRLSDR